ncbi:MAG: hypothetical protein KDD62_10730, partial [Bdellovibrionales bacterium]|nr:hypothetical protein [Bdellovibrionales bacterium]
MLKSLQAIGVSTTWSDSAIKKAHIARAQEEHAYRDSLLNIQTSGYFCHELAHTYCAIVQQKKPLSTISQAKALPLFDYRFYFQLPETCSERSRAKPFTTERNKLLSSTSYQSSYGCDIGSLSFKEDMFFTENLYASLPIHLTKRIASRGSVDLVEVSLALNSMIIAGGDVFIGKVRAEQLSYLTIVSASGKIHIESVEGPARFRLYALREIDSPDTIISSAQAPTPKLASIVHLSIY